MVLCIPIGDTEPDLIHYSIRPVYHSLLSVVDVYETISKSSAEAFGSFLFVI